MKIKYKRILEFHCVSKKSLCFEWFRDLHLRLSVTLREKHQIATAVFDVGHSRNLVKQLKSRQKRSFILEMAKISEKNGLFFQDF